MSSSSSSSLEQRVQQLFVMIDSLDFFEEYYDQLRETVDSCESQLTDLESSEWADGGLVTFELRQRYRIAGEEQRIRAPTSVVFRRGADGWKIVLIHSVPIADRPTG